MALFKIFKGTDTNKLTNPAHEEYVPLKDGYCYFDTTTGLFFIDAENANGEVVRAPINAGKAIYDKEGHQIDKHYLAAINFTPLRLGTGYGVSSEAEAVLEKTASIPDLLLKENSIFFIKFENNVFSSSTLTINEELPKMLLYNEQIIPSNLIKANDVCMFRNIDSGYELININSDMVDKAELYSPAFSGIPTTPTPDKNDSSMQIANTLFITDKLTKIIDGASDDYNTLKKIEEQVKSKADQLDTVFGELVPFPTVGEGILTFTKNGSETLGTFSANALANKTININIPTDLSAFTNTPGYKTTDHNTTYTLSGNDRTITLTPSSGAAMSYTIPESIVNGGTITGPLETEDLTTKQYISFKDSTGTILGKIGYASSTNPVLYIGESANQIYHTGNLDEVTTTVAGLMSAEDKVKLDSISAEATKYTPPEYTSYASGLYKITTNKYGHVATATAVTGHDIENILGYTPSDNEHTHLYAGSESVGGPANSVKESLSFAVGGVEKGSYNGSEGHRIEINAVDLNISSALKYIGRTNNEPVDSVITLVSGNQVIAEPGNVVIWTQGNIEYLFDDDYTWIELGEASSFSLAPHIHGNISNQGYLTDENGLSLSNRILTTDGTGYIHGAIEFAGTTTQRFLNEDGSWQQVNVDNFYHGTGAWGGQDGLTYSAQAYGGAPALELTLPTVTADTKGVVGVGNNITLASGIISITKTNVETALGFTPLASTTKYALSDSVGGDALKAKKMSSGAGNTKLPIYIANDGTPTEIDSTDVAISITGSAGSLKDSKITLTGDLEGEIIFNGDKEVTAEVTVSGGGGGQMLRADLQAGEALSIISIPSTITDFINNAEDEMSLLVYQNGLLLNQTENYTVGTTNTTIELVDYVCESGDLFTFIAISNSGYTFEDIGELGFLPLSGGTLSGLLTLAGDPVESLHAVTKQYVDNSLSDLQENLGNLDSYVAKTGDTMTGRLIINYNGDVAAATANSGTLIIGNPTGEHIAIDQTEIMAKSNGTTATTLHLNAEGGKVQVGSGGLYGAVWNDYAEFRSANSTEPGRCIIEVGDDTLALATKRMQPGASIISDTFGFAIGETDEACTPIAVSGRVLAYGYEDREEFRKAIGRPVCSGPDGTVSIMTDEEYQKYGYCAIGTISAIPDYETWGSGNVPVNGRIWIKVV